MPLIESLIRRASGTKVTFGGKTYEFKPTSRRTAHVADVKDEEHAKRLLSIEEGYREYDESNDEPDTALTGIAGVSNPLGDNGKTLVPSPTSTMPLPNSPAVANNTLTPQSEGNGAEAAGGDAGATGVNSTGDGTGTGDSTGGDNAGEGGNPLEQDKEEATKAYIEHFGKKPHHTWSADLIRAKLAEDKKGEGK